jgi:hypothetical protein
MLGRMLAISLPSLLLAVAVLFTVAIVRLAWVLRPARRQRRTAPAKTLVVFGSGEQQAESPW